MGDWKLPWAARCRCERVEMRVTAPPLLTMACHCTGCQRMTGSAYALGLTLLATGFEIVRGDPVIGGMHGATRHYHCPHCKSWLFTRPEGLDHLVNLRAPLLDDRSWFVPFVEMCTAEGYPWARTGAQHSFAAMPDAEAFAALVAEYTSRGVRPA